MKFVTVCAGGSLALLLCASAGVQASEISPIDPLVISAIRSNVDELEAPYTVRIVDEETLDRKLVRSLPEALNETPGVHVQKTANGHGSPFIRGFTGHRTLALIDGIRYNNSVYRDGPNEYFGLIDAYSLNQITLLAGPSATLYGSDAIGGTLYLETKASKFFGETAGETFAGGQQFFRYSSGEESFISRSEFDVGVGGQWGLVGGLSAKDFGNVQAANLGELPNTGYNEIAFDARLDASLSDNWSLTVVHQNLRQDDVWRTHSTTSSRSFSGTTLGTDLQRLKDQKRSLDYLKIEGYDATDFLDAVTLTLSHQRWNEDGDRIRASGQRIVEDFRSRMFGVDLQLESDALGVGVVYGLDYYRDEVDTARTDFNPDGSVDRVRIQGPVGDDATYTQFGAYVQADIPVTDYLQLILGSRYSHVSASVGAYEDPATGLPAQFENDWSNLSSSARATYSLDETGNRNIWTGLAQSFRAPNIADISRFGGSRSNETEVAATGLSPEKFLTFEVGYKQVSRNLDFSITYYFTNISDYITSTPTGRIVGGLTEVSKQNSSDGHVQGIELAAEYRLNENWRTSGNLTWLEGELETAPQLGSTDRESEPLSRIMPLTASVSLHWEATDAKRWATFTTSLTDRADRLSAGDIADTQRIPPGGTPGYVLVSLRGGTQVTDYLSADVALTNLLDQAYRSHGSGSNEPGFGITAGVKITF